MRFTLAILIAAALALSCIGQEPTPTPPNCEKPELLTYGRPIFSSPDNGLSFGLSLTQREFKPGAPIKLNVWVNNHNDAPAHVATCSDLAFLKARGLELFLRDGRRIPSREELSIQEKCTADPRRAAISGLWDCPRNLMFEVPPHTCMTRGDYDFSIDLTSLYDLRPGDYVIRLREKWRNPIDLCKPLVNETPQRLPSGPAFTVKNP